MAIKFGGVESTIKKKGFIKGLFLGLIVVAMHIASFYYMTGTVDAHPLLVLPGSFIFTIVIPLIFIVVFILNIRKSIGGYWSFRQAVTAIFIMLFTSYIMLAIGRDILFVKLVEPNMAQKIGAVMMESRMRKDQLDGMPQAQIIRDLASEKKNFNLQTDNGQWAIVESIPENILITFVLAVMLSAVFKKERPYLAEKTVE
ncbi:MAG: DUF4199 domain-containing protein [Sphingobacteriales bacterium]